MLVSRVWAACVLLVVMHGHVGSVLAGAFGACDGRRERGRTSHLVWLVCDVRLLSFMFCPFRCVAAVPNYVQGTPSATRVTDVSLHINVRLDTQGYFYFVILARGADPPVAKNVKEGLDADGGPPIVAGSQQVTTTTLTFTEIVFQKLNLSTAYDIYVVAEDDEQPPNTQPIPTLVQFTTLEGRKLFTVGRGGRENNRLGLGDVLDRWTPAAVPAWDNVTVNQDAHYTDITLKCTWWSQHQLDVLYCTVLYQRRHNPAPPPHAQTHTPRGSFCSPSASCVHQGGSS